MSLNQALVDDTRDWLRRAENDLRAAEVLHQINLPEEAAFHSQQAAEKALKALLYWNNQPIPRTHDVAVLGAACVVLDPTLAPIVQQAQVLTVFATDARYPLTQTKVDPQQLPDLMSRARTVFDEIKNRIQLP